MFVLTCPECSHRVRVRFAKIGVTAGCPSCDHKFRLDSACMADEKEILKSEVSMKASATADPRHFNSATRVADSQIKPLRVSDSGPLEETLKVRKHKRKSSRRSTFKASSRSIEIPVAPEPIRELPPLDLSDRKRWKNG